MDASPGDINSSKIFVLSSTSKEKPGKSYPSVPTNEEVYKFAHNFMGIAIIFNQVTFKDLPERKGSAKDANDLKTVLTEMGFTTKDYLNSSRTEIRQALLQGFYC